MRINELIEKAVREVIKYKLEIYVEKAVKTYMEYIVLDDFLAENLKLATRVEAIIDNQIGEILDE